MSDEEKAELSQYAKNYIPILFNLYTAEEKEGDPDKLPLLETIRMYLSLAKPEVSIRNFERSFSAKTVLLQFQGLRLHVAAAVQFPSD